jgi:hypothetical protein
MTEITHFTPALTQAFPLPETDRRFILLIRLLDMKKPQRHRR